MPSAQDILDAINNNTGVVGGKLDTVNNSLTVIQGKLDAINASVNAVDADVQKVDADVQKVQQLLLWGFQQLVTLGQYTNQALFENDQQNDTMICILEHISQNTCGIVDEAHTQTGLQKSISHAVRKLADLYANSHAEAELAREERERLQDEIEKCCPPKPPEPVCVYQPCPAPPPFTQAPPVTQPPPQLGPPPTK